MASFCTLTICTMTTNADVNGFDNSVKENIKAHLNIMRGIGSYESGNYKDAIKYYDIAITLAPDTEIAEAGWAGKELAFYKQGKNEEALCCYCKLKNIDRNTNLIEKSKKELLNSASGSVKASYSVSNTSDEIRAGIFSGFIHGINYPEAIPEDIGFGLGRLAKLGIEKGLASSKGRVIATVLEPEVIIPATIIILGILVYDNREELTNYINNNFYETNISQISNPLRPFF